ncbi:hypothetical protein Pan44_10150 [Caulifigura coniformis]|uniref:Uncharacterized protein n=1 Tax=Caulifigura coniformis TaxID=2527983 RepID=A0A517SA44_9PLAN|nr:hypothetical protein [Caulifigura coniformis]QDT53000.1 hypothetical protein Pan44_10150 [Caulifigura coniformis]
MTFPHLHRRPFAYRHGVDGTDLTFDIVYLPTNTVIAALAYWDDRAPSKRAARQIVSAMNQLFARSAYIYDGWVSIADLIDGSKHQASLSARTLSQPTPSRPPLPADPESMNDRRAAGAARALAVFRGATGSGLDDSLGDLLADLIRWCDRHQCDFDVTLDRARIRYAEETGAERES